jgi:hypothetical protein
MQPTEIRVPGGIRWWLKKRHVASGTRVGADTVICTFEMTSDAFSDGPEADADLEAFVPGVIEWTTDVVEGQEVEQGRLIGWIHPD